MIRILALLRLKPIARSTKLNKYQFHFIKENFITKKHILRNNFTQKYIDYILNTIYYIKIPHMGGLVMMVISTKNWEFLPNSISTM